MSILLTLTMLLSLFPGMAVTVSAVDGTPEGRGGASVEISTLDADIDYETTFGALIGATQLPELITTGENANVRTLFQDANYNELDLSVSAKWQTASQVNGEYVFTDATSPENAMVMTVTLTGNFTLADDFRAIFGEMYGLGGIFVGPADNFTIEEDGRCVWYVVCVNDNPDVPGGDELIIVDSIDVAFDWDNVTDPEYPVDAVIFAPDYYQYVEASWCYVHEDEGIVDLEYAEISDLPSNTKVYIYLTALLESGFVFADFDDLYIACDEYTIADGMFDKYESDVNNLFVMFIEIGEAEEVLALFETEDEEPKTESNVNSDTFEKGELTVEGLIDEAKEWLDKIEAANPADDIKVAVDMTVEVKPSDIVNEGEKDAIEDIASAQSSNLQYLDITIVKTVLINDVKSDADSGPISETHDLIEIEIVFPTAGRTNFKVYRYHDGNVQTLTEIPGADGECIVVGEGKITIKAKFFSTYAVGYEDNNGPVHVNYTDSNKADFYWDGTTNLTIADEAVITITKPYTQSANLTISADAQIVGGPAAVVTVNNKKAAITITSNADVVMSGVNMVRNLSANADQSLIIVNGASLCCEDVIIVANGQGVFEINGNGSLIMTGDDTSVISTQPIDAGRPLFDNVYGTLTIYDGYYKRTGNSGQIIGNGTANGNSVANIYGGTFENTTDATIDLIANGEINVYGGTFFSNNTAAIRSGKTGDKVTITGGTIKNSAKAVRLGRDTDASAGTVVIGGNVSFEGNTVDVYLTLKNSVSNVVTIRDDFTGRISVKSSKALATNEKLPITTDGTAKKLRSQVYSADAKLAVSFEDTGYLYLWKHVHDYTQDVVDDEYLVSPATCDALAVYLKSCECGNGSDDASKVFASGSLRTHDYGFKSNGMEHWDECLYDDCKDVINKVSHTFTEFHNDADSHWYECSHIACTKISGETSHDFVRMTDNNYHWYQCSDPACKFIKDKEAHTSSDWIVDVYEQVGVNGRMHKECTVCEHVLATVVIPALSPEKKDDHDDVVVKPDFTNCPKDATCPVWFFKDAVAFEWYHDGVHYCIENGLMNGLPENLFDPAGATTRAQTATMLMRFCVEIEK